jgi:protein MAK16
LIGIKKKLDRREAVRERKALSAAHLERLIEKELIERLKSKAYGDAPLNVNEDVWRAILDRERNGERTEEFGELSNLERHEEMEGEFGDPGFISDTSGEEDDSFSDMGDTTVSS